MRREKQADARLLPGGDLPSHLTFLAAAAMAFIAAVVLALSLSATRTAERWQDAFRAGITIELPHETPSERRDALLRALSEVAGVGAVSVIGTGDQAALLSPWLGDDIDAASLRLPVLIDIEGDADPGEVAARVEAVAPDGVVLDHADWRDPVVRAADRIASVALAALILTLLVAATVVWLAASATVASSERVIEVLRLVGATDRFVISRFARPFAIRAASGALLGTALAAVALALVRLAGPIGPLVAGPLGLEWLWLVLLPLVAGVISWGAARLSAMRLLRRLR